MKIIALEAENVKHLKVIRIEPDGSLVVIGGDNSAGKTCVLDSIEYALNGAGSIPIKPIRSGQKKARVVLDLGEIVVTRTFTEKGTSLVVKNKEGATFASPQSMLDKLVGALAFDPLEFSKMDARKQAEVLKKLVGLDFDKIDAQYKDLFEQRTVVNREGKILKGQLDGMTRHGDVPDKVVSITELTKSYAEAVQNNEKIETLQREIKVDKSGIERLEEQISTLKIKLSQNEASLKLMEKTDAKIVDVKIIDQKMETAESTNNKVRENQVYDETNRRLKELRVQSKSLSDKMEKTASQKDKLLAKAKFPIEGLAIDEDGVTFEDIPFVQCSSSQQIKISVAMGLAMNPKLRVLLIREGSLLDKKNLAMVAKMAEKADAQIWIERVSKGNECSVIIEDGSVLCDKEMAKA